VQYHQYIYFGHIAPSHTPIDQNLLISWLWSAEQINHKIITLLPWKNRTVYPPSDELALAKLVAVLHLHCIGLIYRHADHHTAAHLQHNDQNKNFRTSLP